MQDYYFQNYETGVKFNDWPEFVKDVCYKGTEKLTDSFLKGEAEGLKLMYPEAKTIYPYLSKLPENMKTKRNFRIFPNA